MIIKSRIRDLQLVVQYLLKNFFIRIYSKKKKEKSKKLKEGPADGSENRLVNLHRQAMYGMKRLFPKIFTLQYSVNCQFRQKL